MSRRHMYDETYTYAPYNAMVYNNAIYRQNKNNRVIQDVASEDINYKTNITNVPEYDFSNEGFEFNNVELAKKGPLYFPENIDSYKEKGTYM